MTPPLLTLRSLRSRSLDVIVLLCLLLLPIGSALGQSEMIGEGERRVDEKSMLTAGVVTSISPTLLALTFAAETKSFVISTTTKFCAEGKSIPRSSIKVGDRVTVTTMGGKAAASIAKGALVFSMGDGFGLTFDKNKSGYLCGLDSGSKAGASKTAGPKQ